MLTAEQISMRTESIGSSDASAIVGLNPWRTPVDVWLEKTGRAASFKGNEATEAGDLLEDAVINRALQKIKAVSHERAPELMYADGLPFISARLDCTAVLPEGDRTIVEGKTSGITKMLDMDAWGEEWSDAVPDYYKIQVQHQLFVAGPDYQFAILSALIPPRGFVMFCLPRQQDVIDALVERHIEFWECVRTDTPPEGEASIEVAKRLRRLDGKETNLDWTLVASLERAKSDLKAAKDQEEKSQAALLLALGDAEIGKYEGGIVTYKESTRKSYTVAESSYRTLRIKPTKGK